MRSDRYDSARADRVFQKHFSRVAPFALTFGMTPRSVSPVYRSTSSGNLIESSKYSKQECKDLNRPSPRAVIPPSHCASGPVYGEKRHIGLVDNRDIVRANPSRNTNFFTRWSSPLYSFGWCPPALPGCCSECLGSSSTERLAHRPAPEAGFLEFCCLERRPRVPLD